jgi:hypothetical protein
VAGKPYRGVGDDDGRPRLIDEDDAQGLNSGPTVVDDQKVAEVLKKLRSLDRPPGPLTGVTEVVVDADSSEPTRIDSISSSIEIDTGPAVQLAPGMEADTSPARLEDMMYPGQRPTAIGRSFSTPADGQPVTIPPDAARGTLFGHSIHLPDVNSPDAIDAEISSGAIDFLDGAPAALQPFPLADRPALVVPPPTSSPRPQFRTPFEADLHTQLVDPRRSKGKRLLAFVGGLSIAGLGVFAWMKYGGGSIPGLTSTPQAAAPAVVPTPSPVAPSAAAPAPTEGTAPAPAAAAETHPAAAAPTTAAAEAPVAPPADEPTPPAPAEPARKSRRSSTTERRAAKAASSKAAPSKAAPAPSKDAPPPSDDASKPNRAHKKAGVSEDPDATLPPSE